MFKGIVIPLASDTRFRPWGKKINIFMILESVSLKVSELKERHPNPNCP